MKCVTCTAQPDSNNRSEWEDEGFFRMTETGQWVCSDECEEEKLTGVSNRF